MKVRELLPTSWKSVVHVLVALVIIKVVMGFVEPKLPASIQPYTPYM
jgi:hypothetical protein